MRDVQPVLAAEAEEEVVARDARDLLRLEAEQLPDPVVLVDDVVAGPEIGEGLEGAAEAGAGARRTLAEDLRVREQDEPEVAPDEPAPGGRDREEEARLVRQLPALLEPLDLEAAEQGRGAEAVAAVREGDDNALARTDEGGQLLLGLGEPARRDRRPLGLEGMRLATRERDRAAPPLRAAPASSCSSSQTRSTSSGSKTRSGGRSSTGTRSSGTPGASPSSRRVGSTRSRRRSAAG